MQKYGTDPDPYKMSRIRNSTELCDPDPHSRSGDRYHRESFHHWKDSENAIDFLRPHLRLISPRVENEIIPSLGVK